MSVGIIGVGSMGGMLVRAWLRTGTLSASDLQVANRSPGRLAALQQDWPGLRTGTPQEVAACAEMIWLCVKPGDTAAALEAIGPELTPGKLLVVISNTVPMAKVEERVAARVAKVIPSIAQEALAGVTLVMSGSRTTGADREHLFTLLQPISRPVTVREEQGRTAADITSCGPAFLAAVCLHMARAAAAAQPDLTEKKALDLVRETLQGTARLVGEQNMDPHELINRVRVPGGVTATGLEALDRALPQTWAELFAATRDLEERKIHQLSL